MQKTNVTTKVKYYKNSTFQFSTSLANNFEMAAKRIECTQKIQNRNPDLLNTFGEIIEKYEKKGYITKVSNTYETQWYLSQFLVVRLNKAKAKVRIVLDASAKQNGLPLNDVIYQGTRLQIELFDVLLRLKKQVVAIIRNIEEMKKCTYTFEF